jgi:arabinose-5-phosphate isomerase
MQEMSAKGLGASAVADAQGKVLGIFTDGDLRRLIEKGIDMRTLLAEQVMHPRPRTVSASALAAERSLLDIQSRQVLASTQLMKNLAAPWPL